MQGKNHIISNICSAVLGADSLFLLKNTMNNFDCVNCSFYKNVKIIFDNIINSLVPNTTSTVFLCLWWSGVVLLFCLGTLLPDCDTEKSIIGRVFHIPVEHRTWTHAVWFPLFIFVCSIWMPILFYLGAGYFLHLLWDNLSVSGVCFLYPISKYKYYGNTGAKIKCRHWLKLYRTGKISEGIVVGVLIALTVLTSIHIFMNL